MEGLEISILTYSDYKSENNTLRLDSEFFRKKYLTEDKNREKYVNIQIQKFAYVTDGQHGYHEVDESSPIHLLTAKNAKKWFADTVDADPLAKWVDDNNKRSSLELDDVILTTRGTVGFCAIVKKEVLPANIDQDVARIYIEDKSVISPGYLISYLNCSYGQDWLKRNQSGMVQQGLPLQRVRECPIPLLSTSFQQQISQIIESAYQKKIESEYAYLTSEKTLLKAVNLQHFNPENKLYGIKNFRESFGISGRLDSEYYQPKFAELLHIIKQQNYDRLGNLVSIRKSIEPGSAAYQESGIPFIRVSNLFTTGLTTPEIHLDKKTYGETIRPIKNTILLSKDGTVGIAFKVPEDLDVITSGAILHLTLKSKKIIPDYLTLVLNSIITRLQAERDSGGSIIQHWKPSEIEQVIIPIIEMEHQLEITGLIKQSFLIKAESEQLLKLAKRAVEIAIEEGEENAIALINQLKP